MSNKLGPKPELRWIDKRLLQVDSRYQRSIENRNSQRLIDKIAEEFSWFHCSAIVVAPAGKGRFNILDGQHRWAAAIKRADIKDLPCVLSMVTDLRQQATAFVALNRDRVALTSLAIFWSMYEAGDPEARGIVSAAREAGVNISRTPVPFYNRKTNDTMAIAPLMKLYRGELGGSPGGRKMVYDILALLREAYPDTAGQISSSMIYAVTRVLSNQVKRRYVLEALKKTTTQELQLAALEARTKDDTLKIRDAFYKALWKIVLSVHAGAVEREMAA